VGLCESSCERGFELRREGTARGTGTAHTPSPNCALRYGVWLWIQVYAERGCSRSRAALRLMIPRPWQWHGHTTRARATVKAAAAPSSAFDLCGCIQRALLATRGLLEADTVCTSRNSFADALFTQGLMALVAPPTVW